MVKLQFSELRWKSERGAVLILLLWVGSRAVKSHGLKWQKLLQVGKPCWVKGGELYVCPGAVTTEYWALPVWLSQVLQGVSPSQALLLASMLHGPKSCDPQGHEPSSRQGLQQLFLVMFCVYFSTHSHA